MMLVSYMVLRWRLVLCSAVLAAAPTVAFTDGIDTTKGQEELRAAVNSLKPQPTTDKKPIELTIAGVHYSIPRNYIVSLSNWNLANQYFIVLKVNIFDFSPLNDKNKACFASRFPDLTPDCEPLEFRIQGIGPPNAEQAFQNSKSSFISQKPAVGPSGFELYKSGTEDNRIEYYRIIKYGRTNLYDCQIFLNKKIKDGLCSPVSDLTEAGPALHYFFPIKYIGSIVDIDKSIRDIVDGFVVKSGG